MSAVPLLISVTCPDVCTELTVGGVERGVGTVLTLWHQEVRLTLLQSVFTVRDYITARDGNNGCRQCGLPLPAGHVPYSSKSAGSSERSVAEHRTTGLGYSYCTCIQVLASVLRCHIDIFMT